MTFEFDIYTQDNDNPTTCPQCGARTDFIQINDTQQVHQCLSTPCSYVFATVEDDEPQKFAIQCDFVSGWDYIGSDNGERLLFDSFEEATEDLDSDKADMVRMGQNPADFRVVPYKPEDDTKSDL